MRGHVWPKFSISGTITCLPVASRLPGSSPPRDGSVMGTPDHLLRVPVECCEHYFWLRRVSDRGRRELEETGKRRSWCGGER